MGTVGAYQHYGSAMNLVDYQTTTGVFYWSGEFYPSDKWTFSVGGTYAMSEADFDPVKMELPEETVEHADYDFSEVHEYSDLEFNQLELVVGGSRQISKKSSAYLKLAYLDLSDEKPYAYGDQDGSVVFVASGIKVGF